MGDAWDNDRQNPDNWDDTGSSYRAVRLRKQARKLLRDDSRVIAEILNRSAAVIEDAEIVAADFPENYRPRKRPLATNYATNDRIDPPRSDFFNKKTPEQSGHAKKEKTMKTHNELLNLALASCNDVVGLECKFVEDGDKSYMYKATRALADTLKEGDFVAVEYNTARSPGQPFTVVQVVEVGKFFSPELMNMDYKWAVSKVDVTALPGLKEFDAQTVDAMKAAQRRAMQQAMLKEFEKGGLVLPTAPGAAPSQSVLARFADAQGAGTVGDFLGDAQDVVERFGEPDTLTAADNEPRLENR